VWAVDATTIEQARQGSRPAQARVLRALQDRWFRLSVGLLGDRELARDATQETALRVLKRLSRFDGRSSLATWSMGIAINVAREMRRQRRRAGSAGDAANDQPGGGPLPLAAAQRTEERDRLIAALAELPMRQREAVVLRYFEGMSVAQTAEAMDCAAGTVKAAVHQALRALRSRLRQLA
jgi:RNA polymerase sigma-70 factor (ECF subfamily)